MKLKNGRYLIRTKWFRLYYDGSFSMLEIDFGRIGGWELVIHIMTIRGFMALTLNEPLERMERKIATMVKNGEI